MTVADTTPYAWPYSGSVDPTRVVLIVCGWDDHWAAATQPSPAVLANIGSLADAAPWTISVRHQPPRRTDVVAPAPPLPHIAGTPVPAVGIDAFYDSNLSTRLITAGCTQVLLAGLGLETTVHSTMRTANDRGLECLLIADACAPVDDSLTRGAISSVEMSGGIFGAVGTTAPVLHALGPTNRHHHQLKETT